MQKTFRERITPALNHILNKHTFLCLLYMKLTFRFCRPDRRLLALKDSHKGERCFVVGLGPSLTLDDLNTLYENRAFSFSMNRCYQMFNKTKWRPNCYLVADAKACTTEARRAMGEMMDGGTSVFYSRLEINNMPSRALYFKADFVDFVLRNSKKEKYLKKAHYCRMSTDAYRFVYPGSTSVHSIIQLAYYMGFKEVYLLGTDCGLDGNRIYADALPAFDNNAYAQGEGSLMIRDYESMKKDIAEKGLDFHVYNATRGGYLEVFPRVDFDQIWGQA